MEMAIEEQQDQVIVRRAIKEDFYPVFKLLRASTLNSKDLTIDVRRRMFYPVWRESENYYGYVLADGDDVVGFLGTFFTERKIEGKTHAVCEIHSWYVRDEYRHESLKLLMPVLGQKNLTIVNYTPTQDVYEISEKLGFKNLESELVLAYPVPTMKSFSVNYKLISDPNEIYKYLSDDERVIFNDHLAVPCHHFVLLSSKGNEYSYFIVKKLRRRFFEPFGRVLHVTNKSLFLSGFDFIKLRLALRFRLQCLVFNKEDLGGYTLAFSKIIARDVPSQYKSRSLKQDALSQLYSVPVMLGYKLH